MDVSQLSKIAIKAARAAGKIIQQHMNKTVSVEIKTGGTSYASQVVTAVDKACETAILAHLLPTCDEFDLALLSEETEDDERRFEKAFFWCIDPMDGTLAFINKRSGFSVSIALIANEAMSNAIRHADATTIEIHVIETEGKFTITVSDDGKGFDTTLLNTNDGLGLQNMQKRASLYGGHVHIESDASTGTNVTISIPLRTQ